MSELVSRLLAAIDERVREHGRVAEELRECARQKITVPNRDYLQATITDGLRLCEANADIVARYEHARKRSQTAPEPERILWHTRTIALIDVMDLVARGYGVEDGEGQT